MTDKQKEYEEISSWSINELNNRKDVKEINELYQIWAKDYDRHMVIIDWKAPRIAAECLGQLLSNKKDARILDIAAGTGLVAKHLREHGFTNIDALDGSQAMLDKAKQKGLYKNYMCRLFGPEGLPDIATDSYDGITLSGGTGANHTPADGIVEMIRIVKPGGYIVQVYFDDLAEGDIEWLPGFQESLVKKGAIDHVRKEHVKEIFPKHDGFLMAFKVKVSEVKES